ncbi:MAG: hypothetical protein AAGA37_06660 [Actinomycetota bacterium]
MANHIEHLAAEAAVTAGSLKVLLLTGLASVDEVSLAASSRVADVEDSDLLLLASATGRGRLDVLEDLADLEPTALDIDAVRLAAILVVLDRGFDEWEVAAIREQFDDPIDMERTSPHLQDAGADYLGPEGETRALVEVLRARVRAGRA